MTPLDAAAETVMRWRGGAATCTPHIENGLPDVHNGLGYGNIWPNADGSLDSYADAYCPVPYGIGMVNEIIVVAAEEAPENWIRAQLLACSLSNEYCYDRGYVTSTYSASRSQYRADLNGNYDISFNQLTGYYWVLAIRLYDGDRDDFDVPRAYWVGLDYDTSHGALAGESLASSFVEVDPYPECAERCPGDCSFLSFSDDEFWLTGDWTDYCGR